MAASTSSSSTGPTTEEVHALRLERGIGLLEAKRILVRGYLLRELDAAADIDDLKVVIRKLIA